MFTKNSTESINSVLKSWENSKNDSYSFTNSYEKLLDNQNSNILRAFLGLESHYVVREEFENHCMEFIVFSQLTCDEKEKLKNELCNVIVGKTWYEQVMHFKNDNAAIQNLRKNINSSFCSNDKNLVLNMEIILSDSLNEDFFSQPVNLNEDIVSAIIAMRPEYSKESIGGAVTKAQKIVKNNKIVPGFDSNKRFVKSSSSHQPHTVSIHGEGCLTRRGEILCPSSSSSC